MDDASQVTDSGEHRAAAAADYARRAASFGAAAADYARYRPDYPLRAVRWALAPVTRPNRQGPRSDQLKVIDIGAGTGKLTAQLASLDMAGSEVSVTAIEPDPAMLAELRRLLPGVTALTGRAEAIPLPDAAADAVLAGQAAHWFDLRRAMPEIARVLRPGGVFGGLWNADDSHVAWVAGMHEVSGRRTVVPIGGRDRDDQGMASWLGRDGRHLFEPVQRAEFSHGTTRTADSLIAMLRTHSAFLIMESAEREVVLTRVRDYLAGRRETASGEFCLPMVTLAIRTVRR